MNKPHDAFPRGTSQGEVRSVDFLQRAQPAPDEAQQPEDAEPVVLKPSWIAANGSQVRTWWPGAEHEQAQQAPQSAEEPTLDPSPQLQAHLEEVMAEAREVGHAEGLEEGFRQGVERAQQDVDAELTRLRELAERLQHEVERLATCRRQALVQAEKDAVALAMEVGQRLAGEALLGDVAWVEPLVRQAVESLTEADRVVCRLSPELHERLARGGIAMADTDKVTVEVMPDFEPLDLVIESRFGRVDASFNERFEQLRRAVNERLETIHEPPIIDEDRADDASLSPDDASRPVLDEEG